jgi:hypothetical protein
MVSSQAWTLTFSHPRPGHIIAFDTVVGNACSQQRTSVEQNAPMLTYHKACSYILQTQTRVQSHVLNISQTPRIVHVGEIGREYFANIYL